MSDVSATLAERGGRYGAFINHATIAQGLQEVLHDAPNWWRLEPDMRQAMCVICDKMARILNGDPYYEDNWHDIQGYAKLVENRILQAKKREEERVQSTPTDGHDGTWHDGQADSENWERDHSETSWSRELTPVEGKPGYFTDKDGKLWGPGEDKLNSSHYDVGQYRG